MARLNIVAHSEHSKSARTGADTRPRPRPLLENLDELRARMQRRPPALFLDFDGTLAPIVARPELARIDETIRALLRNLAQAMTVVVVSGRDREDVEQLVGLDSIVYAGSHGFDIRGPDNLHFENDVGEHAIPLLDGAQRELEAALREIDGVQFERKRFSLAVHVRHVNDESCPFVERAVDAAIDAHAGLRKTHGKKVFEIQPDVDWNKGRAVLWLLEALNVDTDTRLPIFIGDDVTDEDAFRALRECGVGVLVSAEDRPTEAHFCLRDVAEVASFLRWLAHESAMH